MHASSIRCGHLAGSRRARRAWLAVWVVAMWATLSACSVGTLPGDSSAQPDAGEPNEDVRTQEDVGTEPDTTTKPDPWDKHAESVFSFCGAGGVSAGDGVQAIQCYGPAELSGETPGGSTGDGETVTWQPGAMRVVTP